MWHESNYVQDDADDVDGVQNEPQVLTKGRVWEKNWQCINWKMACHTDLSSLLLESLSSLPESSPSSNSYSSSLSVSVRSITSATCWGLSGSFSALGNKKMNQSFRILFPKCTYVVASIEKCKMAKSYVLVSSISTETSHTCTALVTHWLQHVYMIMINTRQKAQDLNWKQSHCNDSWSNANFSFQVMSSYV